MIEEDFKNVINEMKEDIKNTQFKTMQEVNSNLIMLYFRLGKIVSENKAYGSNFTKNVKEKLPDNIMSMLPTEEDINLHIDIKEEEEKIDGK